jgi:hypothetical protein
MMPTGIKTVLDLAIVALMAGPTNPVYPVILVLLARPEVMMLCERPLVMTNSALAKVLHFRYPIESKCTG